jgi:pimeloyl-ACP methyl ester carboxylesterase
MTTTIGGHSLRTLVCGRVPTTTLVPTMNLSVPPGAERPGFVDLDWNGAPLRLELAWVGAPCSTHPTIVFLHEGLGSVALWKDFPERFCSTWGFSGLVFSRYGYGRSSPRPHDVPLPPEFMERQAAEVLPALLTRLGLARPWLFGHSDGASIALLHASRAGADLAGVVAMAPHVMVEDVSLDAIRAARHAYLDGPLRARLAPYHQDVDSAFWGWNDVWLSPAFRRWDMRARLAHITAPLLAIQGEDDEYGSLEQVRTIGRLAPRAQVVILPGCGHSPHRDAPARVIELAGRFMLGHQNE